MTSLCKRRFRKQASRQGGGFTLVEMIVVVAIIVIILGMILPALTALWAERNLSTAENSIQGLLVNAQGRALQAQGVDSGLFFFVDQDGTQRVAPIEQARLGDLAWQHVFKFSEHRDHPLPKPIRVVPRYIVEEEDRTKPHRGFSETELANERFDAPPDEGQNTQRHRNFFTLVYSSNGELMLRRDVLILDIDDDGDGRGDMTGLAVGTAVERYYAEDDTTLPIDPTPFARTVDHLIADGDLAVNFPSVDGLLVYDDSLFHEAGQGDQPERQKREFLLRTARPFYINRWTGGIVRGPVGEGIAP